MKTVKMPVTYAYSGRYGLYMCGYDVRGRLLFKDSPNGGDYLWDGWRMVKKQEWLGLDLGETVEYVWGKDLSGTMDGAGGVGGLLAVRVDGAWHFPLYDHNGIKRAQSPSRKAQGDRDFKATPQEWSEGRYPATQRRHSIVMYISESGAVSAEYEYDPFGKVTSHTGMDFDFQFSTKFYDPDIGMYYYGYRYYSPELRRWASRDPIGEEGGLNLYGFCGNNPMDYNDPLGMDIVNINNSDKRVYYETTILLNRRMLEKEEQVTAIGMPGHKPLMRRVQRPIGTDRMFIKFEVLQSCDAKGNTADISNVTVVQYNVMNVLIDDLSLTFSDILPKKIDSITKGMGLNYDMGVHLGFRVISELGPTVLARTDRKEVYRDVTIRVWDRIGVGITLAIGGNISSQMNLDNLCELKKLQAEAVFRVRNSCCDPERTGLSVISEKEMGEMIIW